MDDLRRRSPPGVIISMRVWRKSVSAMSSRPSRKISPTPPACFCSGGYAGQWLQWDAIKAGERERKDDARNAVCRKIRCAAALGSVQRSFPIEALKLQERAATVSLVQAHRCRIRGRSR